MQEYTRTADLGRFELGENDKTTVFLTMNKYLLLGLVLVALFACTTETPKKQSKAYTTLESGLVTEQVTFNTGGKWIRYYSYAKNQKATTIRFHYDYDSSFYPGTPSLDAYIREKGHFARVSFRLDASGDTLYMKNFPIERGSMGEKHYSKSIKCDSLSIRLAHSTLTVYCYSTISTNTPWIKEFVFVSPKYGYLFAYWPRMDSPRSIIRHPKLSKKDLMKVKEACEEKLLQMKVRKQTAHD